MRRSASLLTRAALASRCSLCSGGDQRRTGALSKLTSPCLLLLRQFFWSHSVCLAARLPDGRATEGIRRRGQNCLGEEETPLSFSCLAEHSRLVFAPHLNKLGKPRPTKQLSVGLFVRTSSWILGACVVAKTNVMGFFIRQDERVRGIIDTTWRRSLARGPVSMFAGKAS